MKRAIKGVFLVFVILFCIVFFNRNNNYYENTNIIGEEAILRFEKDLKEGKEIVPSHYMTPRKDYNNRASQIGLGISHVIEKVVNKTLKKFLHYIAS